MPEIQATFWAWDNFGGIGARTRRGFGALKLSNHKINGNQANVKLCETKEILESQAKKFIYGGKPPKGVPYLDKVLRFASISFDTNSNEIWKELVNAYKSFRQQREIIQEYNEFRGQMEDKPKRGKWNDPEAIRKITNQRLPKHEEIARLAIEKFPRAAFGMPIEFKFKDSFKSNNSRDTEFDKAFYDPRKTSLNLTGFERFSSPLILRPIACYKNKAVGIALIIEDETEIDEIGLTLEAREGTKQSWNETTTGEKLISKLEPNEAKEIKVANERIQKRLGSEFLLGDETDVLQAFLN